MRGPIRSQLRAGAIKIVRNLIPARCDFDALSGCHNLAIALDSDGISQYVIHPEKVGEKLAVAVKANIQTAVRVVTRQSKLVVGVNISKSGRHDPAVCLNSHIVDRFTAAGSEVGERLAIPGKRDIQAAIEVVTRQGELELAARTIRGGRPSRYNLAVGLNSDIVDSFSRAGKKIGENLAVAIEVAVQTAIGVV